MSRWGPKVACRQRLRPAVAQRQAGCRLACGTAAWARRHRAAVMGVRGWVIVATDETAPGLGRRNAPLVMVAATRTAPVMTAQGTGPAGPALGQAWMGVQSRRRGTAARPSVVPGVLPAASSLLQQTRQFAAAASLESAATVRMTGQSPTRGLWCCATGTGTLRAGWLRATTATSRGTSRTSAPSLQTTCATGASSATRSVTRPVGARATAPGAQVRFPLAGTCATGRAIMIGTGLATHACETGTARVNATVAGTATETATATGIATAVTATATATRTEAPRARIETDAVTTKTALEVAADTSRSLRRGPRRVTGAPSVSVARPRPRARPLPGAIGALQLRRRPAPSQGPGSRRRRLSVVAWCARRQPPSGPHRRPRRHPPHPHRHRLKQEGGLPRPQQLQLQLQLRLRPRLRPGRRLQLQPEHLHLHQLQPLHPLLPQPLRLPSPLPPPLHQRLPPLTVARRRAAWTGTTARRAKWPWTSISENWWARPWGALIWRGNACILLLSLQHVLHHSNMGCLVGNGGRITEAAVARARDRSTVYPGHVQCNLTSTWHCFLARRFGCVRVWEGRRSGRACPSEQQRASACATTLRLRQDGRPPQAEGRVAG